MNVLRLWKGRNNGITLGSVVEVDEDGVESAFDITSATITLLIMNKAGMKIAQFTGSIVSATEGTYKAFPDADDLDALEVGQGKYYWATKIVNATYPQGRIFGTDTDNNLQPVIVMGSELAGT